MRDTASRQFSQEKRYRKLQSVERPQIVSETGKHKTVEMFYIKIKFLSDVCVIFIYDSLRK